MMNAQDTHNALDRTALAEPLKCVWMLAGVVAYKLCDRQYECDDCPFDLALRESAPLHPVRAVTTVPVSNRPSALNVWDQASEGIGVQGYELARGLFYDRGHTWARIEEGGMVRVGLDDFGQKLAGRIYAVTLPEPGAQVKQGWASWAIAHQVGETTLAAPVTGVVQQVNEKLALNPSLLNRSPYGQGWAMLIQPKQLVEDLERLYYGEHAQQWYEQEVWRLSQELKNAMASSRPDVGVTLQDGGSRIEDLTRAISASQVQHIIDLFLAATVNHRLGSTARRPMDTGGERS